jgi:hypothetical protein
MGNPQIDIAKTLQVDLSIISRDVSHLRQQSKQNIKKYIDERLPEEYEKCLVGLTSILKEAWTTAQNSEDKREKIQALSLAKECYSMKLELLTNATVVEDAIRFASSEQEQKKKNSREVVVSCSVDSNDDNRTTQQQKNMMATTANQVF